MTGWKLVLLVQLVVSLTANVANAESIRTSSFYRRNQSSSATQRGAYQAQQGAVDVKRNIFRELLSSDAPQLNWPSFPRSWVEKWTKNSYASNTSVGLKVAGNGATASVDYSYGVKTTMVLITTTRKLNQSSNNNDSRSVATATSDLEEMITDEPMSVQEAERDGILHFDYNLNKAFPNVREGSPMVGFCSYEVSLVITKDKHGGINFPVFSQSLSVASSEGMTNTFYSNFFQIRKDVSMHDYLNVYCNRYFRESVEGLVHRDFSKLVLEYFTYNNPKNECQPHDSDKNNPKGDYQCMDWHNNLPIVHRKLTVPRCEMQQNGVHRCVAKAKKNSWCRSYYDKKANRYTAQTNGRRLQLATADRFNTYAFSCDKDTGLSCQIEKEPIIFKGVVVWGGKATCQ